MCLLFNSCICVNIKFGYVNIDWYLLVCFFFKVIDGVVNILVKEDFGSR